MGCTVTPSFLRHTHTHSPCENVDLFQEFSDVLFFECDDICLHRKWDAGFFLSLDTVRKTFSTLIFVSMAYNVLVAYLVFAKHEE